ncbi:RNA polymerase sigma factor [Paenibacillus glycanilyticus]|uniref:RNA polymerase sigma factor n=1 Tax=Paenibacillus glycanilyticus TaxID=126569 RepID=UPI002041C2CA|nr:RNA polymerase sigma factor [Paenibacillus glycanilyticus]MCM3630414.1 RNA polymerase sigma factor [Paenibacillus glycanilyticus]
MKYIQEVDSTELYNLMTQYGDDVWRYAYALTNNYEQASDIAQEVFIKVHLNLSTFRGRSSFKTWLFSITRNLAINELKSNYVRRVLLFGQVKSLQTTQSAEGAYMASQAAEEIRAIVMGLSRKLREVLLLQLEHDMSIHEMAQLLEISEGTVKSRLNRARKQVEKRWRESK